jgi:heme oxygenase
MEYIYKNTTYDLRGLPSLQARLEDPAVVTALHNYLDAVMTYKNAIEEDDAYDEHVWPTPTTQAGLDAHWNKVGQLRRACEQSRKRRKTAWFALMDLLDQDYDYSSTEDEDLD